MVRERLKKIILKSHINLGDTLKYQLALADKCYIATALMKDYGLGLLKLRKESCEVKLLIGIDLPTHVEVFEQLLSQSIIQFKVFEDDKRTFHPKVYLLEIKGKWQAYVGSANFTMGGFESNVEMNLATDDIEHIRFLIDWFEKVYDQGKTVNAKWLEGYKALINELSDLDKSRKDILTKFKRSHASQNDPLAQFDFTGQFFQYKHHNAFSGSKPKERNNKEVILERFKVRRRLFDLHDKVYKEITNLKWDLHPHYEYDHIVSSHQHNSGTADELKSLWLSYNRKKAEIKKIEEVLDKKQTPLLQMRLQVLVHYQDVAIHLTVGKDGGGELERKVINESVRRNDDEFLKQFHDLLKALPDTFYIHVGGETRYSHSFQSDEQFKKYLLSDDFENHYFIIGAKYSPDDQKVNKANIVSTVIADFTLLKPLYDFLKVPIL